MTTPSAAPVQAGRITDDVERASIVALFAEHQSVRVVARLTGRGRQTVRAVLRREGINTARVRPQTPAQAVQLIEAMARAGHTDTAIRQALTERGHTTVGGGPWSYSTVGRISGRAGGASLG